MMRKSLTSSVPRLNRFSTGVRNKNANILQNANVLKNTIVPSLLGVKKSLSQSYSSRNFSSNRSVGLEIVSPLIGLTGET